MLEIKTTVKVQVNSDSICLNCVNYFFLIWQTLIIQNTNMEHWDNVNGIHLDNLGCRISIKMASQSCGGMIANKADTVRAFTASSIPARIWGRIGWIRDVFIAYEKYKLMYATEINPMKQNMQCVITKFSGSPCHVNIV